MTNVQVFDPPMCCPTGVCGPAVDPVLPRFSADLDWLKSQGVGVERYSLSQHPGAFAENDVVQRALSSEGNECLPLVLVNGQIVSRGTYPSREELASLAGLAAPCESIYTDEVAELVAIGAAIAANCRPCFKYHYEKARKVGVSREDMARAVATAEEVRQMPAKAVLELAEKCLGSAMRDQEDHTSAADGCCGSDNLLSSISTEKCC